MNWIESVFERIAEQSALVWWLFAASGVILLASPLVVGLVVAQLPKDYFANPHAERSGWRKRHPGAWAGLRVGRNLLGIVLLFAGVAMLFVPGQGMLTIAVALLLVDFPGKARVAVAGDAETGVAIDQLAAQAGRPGTVRSARVTTGAGQ